MATPAQLGTEQDRALPHADKRLVLCSIIGFWLFYFFFANVHLLMHSYSGFLQIAPRRLMVSLAGICFFYLFSLLLRRLEEKPLGLLVTAGFLGSFVVSLAYGAWNYMIFEIVSPIDWDAIDPNLRMPCVDCAPKNALEMIGGVISHSLEWYFFIVSWSVLYIAFSYAARVRFSERAAARYRDEAQEAQLRALRYQINPHFLFNTLNSLSTLILRQRTDEADRMILNLANFFRASLTENPMEDVTLEEEVRLQRLYLDIEQCRFPERLKVAIDIPDALQKALIPGFLLQPLVENAVKHGVARSLQPVTITLRARAENDKLHVTIEDDGNPILEAPSGTGVGLRNVRERLQARFGGDAHCSVIQRQQGGYCVLLVMPLRSRS
jgi:two-component sensor histidine kinase